MSNDSGDTPNDSGNGPDDSGQNPFKGTPFEQFFNQLGGMGGGGGATPGGFGFGFGTGGSGASGGGAGGAGGFPGFPGGFPGMGGPGGMPDLNQLFGQIQAMMQPYDGPLNWDVALDTARKAVAQQSVIDILAGR